MNPLSPSLDDNSWHNLLAEAAAIFSDVTLSRGFQYYKQKRVQSYTELHERLVIALVSGTELYNVKLNPEAIASSRCECPIGSKCKHIAATLLQYVHQHGRPVASVVNAKSAADLSQLSHSSRIGPLEQLQEQAKQLAEQPMSEWHALFEQGMKLLPEARSVTNPQAVLAALARIKPALSSELEALFEVHAHLFALEKLLVASHQQWQTVSYYSSGYQSQETIPALTQAIAGQLNASSDIAAKPGPDIKQRLVDTLAYVRRQMLGEPGSARAFLNVYLLLWSTWLKPAVSGDSNRFLIELEQLQEAETTADAARSRLPGQLAKSWMHYYLAQDEKALAFLREANKASSIRPHDLMGFLQDLSLEEPDGPRMLRWLIALGDLLSTHRFRELPVYVAHWESVIEQDPEAEPAMWQTLVGMLPSSKAIYEEAMLARGKWQQWIDYQISMGEEPLSYRVAVLQPIEKNAPEALLPFYHQAVERYVLHKNRDGYKSAVKLLKRLAKLYKKLKQETRWEQFITAFSDRHSRLRALQEELRKGKLLE
ncbi:zinc finger SWIM domain protein [Paenibacillus curdlanolyticus YK9]|uniref:Zinc finger SWIM domain protein n=1 Tax=Paenibacillus curdlanolyticus YK9 TaxID=717606 RepID=E0IAQ0_9BACL|nr:SWIM zinc finger family protein [Paenibacillus curdlanolyticus]EFM10454.1 zinc finger SWIM domain protein [Paenibacillus curdlanolyticus YK9]